MNGATANDQMQNPSSVPIESFRIKQDFNNRRDFWLLHKFPLISVYRETQEWLASD
jgi:hypothetical protein